MMYKLYFGNRSICVVPSGTAEDQLSDTVYYDVQPSDDLSQLPVWFEKAGDITSLVIKTDDPDGAFSKIISSLKVEVAAGGMIRNRCGKVLLFWRRGAWDMPKGHQEPGETLEQCALREVQEETGLKGIELGEPICITYHTYHNKGNFVLKEAHWYKMKLTSREKVRVQEEEDIEKAVWCGPWRLKRLLKSAYPSIRDVFAAEQ
ncbi:MAG: NUDIX domain-containing protein [Bacteroidales bacterium]|nr:NUDIX domain-containing protein [Bacteroidales bacterium]